MTSTESQVPDAQRIGDGKYWGPRLWDNMLGLANPDKAFRHVVPIPVPCWECGAVVRIYGKGSESGLAHSTHRFRTHNLLTSQIM